MLLKVATGRIKGFLKPCRDFFFFDMKDSILLQELVGTDGENLITALTTK
jgi:hypothetical protein